MPNIFLTIALLLAGMTALLVLAPRLKLLNIADYGGSAPVSRVNRHAAPRLLLPVAVSLGCACAAETRPELVVPLLFPLMLSILAAVVWIAAGLARMEAACKDAARRTGSTGSEA